MKDEGGAAMESIDNKIKELHEKRKAIELGGGEKRIQKQHKSGKLTARERIEAIRRRKFC